MATKLESMVRAAILAVLLAMGPSCGTSTETGNPEGPRADIAATRGTVETLIESLATLGHKQTDAPALTLADECRLETSCDDTGPIATIRRRLSCALGASAADIVLDGTETESVSYTLPDGRQPRSCAEIASTPTTEGVVERSVFGGTDFVKTRRAGGVAARTVVIGERQSRFVESSPTHRVANLDARMTRTEDDGKNYSQRFYEVSDALVALTIDATGRAQGHEVRSGKLALYEAVLDTTSGPDGRPSVTDQRRPLANQALHQLVWASVGGQACCIPSSGEIRGVRADGSAYALVFGQPDPASCPEAATWREAGSPDRRVSDLPMFCEFLAP